MEDMVKTKGKSYAEAVLDNYKQSKGMRSNFESYWQSLHDYFYLESSDINKAYAPGAELDSTYLYDSTTLEVSDVLASGFMNYLTPPTSKWFRLRTKNISLLEDKQTSDWLQDVEAEVYHAFNKSNFYHQILPCYKSSGVFGTSILLEEEDLKDEIRFYSLPIKQVCITEDARQRIIEFYIEFEYNALQAATRWGEDKLATSMREELASRPDKKHSFLLYIANRSIRDVNKNNKENMPIQATWIDVENKKIMEEGGYHEFPAAAHRFDKRPFIPWGFSPAMKSLPFARILNAIAKTNLRTMMKLTDPPVALPDNAFIMPFNANPRALNYYKKSAMDGAKDIFAFGNYGNPQVGLEALKYYTQKVRSLMFYDVFLAFEGLDKQMNNPEVLERINEKMTLLGPSVGRFTGEVLDPIVTRTIGILWRRGKLPRPPDSLLQNPEYEIEYVSQLAHAQKRSELNSLVTALTMTGQMAQYTPEVLDKINPDKTVDEVWGITGAPVQVLRDDSEVQKIRENRAQAQAQANDLALAQAGANIAKTGSEAGKNMMTSKEKMGLE